MSNFRRIFERKHMDRAARRRHHSMLRAAQRGNVHAIEWLKREHEAAAKRKA